MEWAIGVDVGGTFTDFYLHNTTTGSFYIGKTPSTPHNPAEAIVTGLLDICKKHNVALDSISRLSHGTTVGTNTLIQRSGSKVALITTKGFKDLLEIGRQTRPHMYNLHTDFPAPLVDRDQRFELSERMDFNGDVIIAPNKSDIEEVIDKVIHSEANACALGFLFSFINPKHEREVAELIRQKAPGLVISLSSEVQPEFREYERLSTTVLNAYLQPVMGVYLKTLEDGVKESLPNANIGINQSNGGLMSPERARKFPVRTALSGPAAGAVGASFIAQQVGRKNIITLDMGGTSADVAMIQDFKVSISFDRDVAGFPVRQPSVDVETVGAGGGSIAWFDRDDLLKVGPASAGANPGPACYGLGGTSPTVTDANLILGRLSPRGLLDGSMQLDPNAAVNVFKPIAEHLGFQTEHTAHGVLGIVVANMVRTIRTISVERGYDPRQCVLMPFGGAGPLHARDVAINLGISEMIIPAAPGIVCAQGLLVSDLKEDFVVSRRLALTDKALPELQKVIRDLETSARNWFTRENITPDARNLKLSIDARYTGQNFELSVPLAEGKKIEVSNLNQVQVIHQKFCEVHELAYGYASKSDPVEIINIRLTAIAKLFEFSSKNSPNNTPPPPKADGERPVVFENPDKPTIAKCFNRASLIPGQEIHGPAIIEQLDTTTPLYPGDIAKVSDDGHLIISISSESGIKDGQ